MVQKWKMKMSRETRDQSIIFKTTDLNSIYHCQFLSSITVLMSKPGISRYFISGTKSVDYVLLDFLNLDF